MPLFFDNPSKKVPLKKRDRVFKNAPKRSKNLGAALSVFQISVFLAFLGRFCKIRKKNKNKKRSKNARKTLEKGPKNAQKTRTFF